MEYYERVTLHNGLQWMAFSFSISFCHLLLMILLLNCTFILILIAFVLFEHICIGFEHWIFILFFFREHESTASSLLQDHYLDSSWRADNNLVSNSKTNSTYSKVITASVFSIL